MAVLNVVKGIAEQESYTLAQPRVVVGRLPQCEISLLDNVVSRRHFQITEEHGKYFIEDLGSNNSTYLNEVRVVGRKKLRDSDHIRFCSYVFRFELGDNEFDVTHDLPDTESSIDGYATDSTSHNGSATDSDSEIVVDDKVLAEGFDDDEQIYDGSKKSIPRTVITKFDADEDSSNQRLATNSEAKLRAVLQMSRSLSTLLTLDEVLPNILDGLAQVFPQVQSGTILGRDSNTSELQIRARKNYGRVTDNVSEVSMTIVEQVVAEREGILVSDVASDGRFNESDSLRYSRIRSVMCVPLVAKSQAVLGVVQIGTKQHDELFTKDDMDVMISVMSQASLAIENAILHEEVEEANQMVRRLNLELTHAARLSVVGEIAAGVAHELHQPLSVIVNYASGCERRLLQDTIDREALTASFRDISAEALRAGEIMRGIRDFIKKREVNQQSADINTIIHDAVKLATPASRQYQATIDLRLATNLERVFVDRIQVTQVIVNLLINAVQALASVDVTHRNVVIETRVAPDSAVPDSAVPDSAVPDSAAPNFGVEVSVIDTGPGIDKDAQSKVFEQFYTTKPDGLGIGLAISRSIIKAHQGELHLESKPNQGAKFTLRLPTLVVARNGAVDENDGVELSDGVELNTPSYDAVR